MYKKNFFPHKFYSLKNEMVPFHKYCHYVNISVTEVREYMVKLTKADVKFILTG